MDERLDPDAAVSVLELQVSEQIVSLTVDQAAQALCRERLHLLHQSGDQVIIQRAHRDQISLRGRSPGHRLFVVKWVAIQSQDALAGVDGKARLAEHFKSQRSLVYIRQQTECASFNRLAGQMLQKEMQILALQRLAWSQE